MLVVPSVAIVRGHQEEPELSEESVFEATLAHGRSSTRATTGGWQTILGSRLSVVPRW